MKYQMKYLVLFLSALLMSLPVSAQCTKGYCFQPYVGVGVQYKSMSFKTEAGKDTLPKGMPQIHAYAGLKLSDYFGLEGGAHTSKHTRHKISNHSVQLRGMHFGMVTFLPLASTGVEFIAGAGLSHLKTNITDRSDLINKTKNDRVVLRLIGGTQYMFTDNVGVRTSAIWENTAKIRTNKFKAKDSINYTAGLIVVL